MKAFKNIDFVAGRFGKDNRGWLVDRQNHTISQALSSIKFVNSTASKQLYELKDEHFDTFTDLLRYIQMNCNINARIIKTLIKINYFEQFGTVNKLLDVFKEFSEGKNKVTKTVKSYEKRLEAIRAFETLYIEQEEDYIKLASNESKYIGICITSNNSVDNSYVVQQVDDKYGIRINLFGVKTGKTKVVRFAKKDYTTKLSKGDVISINDYVFRPRYSYNNGKRTKIPNTEQLWVLDYSVIIKGDDD